MIRTRVSKQGFTSLFDEISRMVSEMGDDFYDEVKNNTPVDTGLAKRSWKKSKSRDATTINNTAPYIGELDEGRSKQAPKGMTKPAIDKITSNFNKGKYK